LRRRAVFGDMKTFLILSLLALPLNAEIRGAARGGVFVGADHEAVGTIELDVRRGNWSVAPAYDSIRGGYGLHAIHIDVRRFFKFEHDTVWIGAGPTFVSSNSGSRTTWNADAGFAWRTNGVWEPFIAARYYSFRIPVFRDVVEGNGAVISIGISRRFH
jgi:hypothetical protein